MEYKKVAVLYLFILSAAAQTCSYATAGFSIGTSEIIAPLDTITFDNIELTAPAIVSISPLRATPATSMDVTISGTAVSLNHVRVRTGIVYLNSDMGTVWEKTDYLLAFDSFFNSATVTFENPIRQFSVLVTHSVSCVGTGNIPKLYLNDTEGSSFSCLNINMPPPTNSYNQVTQILKYIGPTANIKHLYFVGCNFAWDNLSFKIDPCNPSPCDTSTEKCYYLGDDAACCNKNSYWSGSACVDTCNNTSLCDPLATCTNLRYQADGFTCTCPPEYFGDGTPGNCTKFNPAPPTNLDVVPILECIDENGVAQFGYNNRENMTLLIEDTLRNNFSPFNVVPVAVFKPGRSTPYPLNAAEVPLNITTDTYTWALEAYRLEFSNLPARACPIQISIIFQFRITGAINVTEFAEQTRATFIVTSGVLEERVILVNFTQSLRATKRANHQFDVTELEVELSILPPANDTQPSSADIIREFVDEQKQDFDHELQQAVPGAEIEVILSTKESDNVLLGVVPPVPESNEPTSEIPTSAPVASGPVRQPVNLVASSGVRYLTVPVSYLLLSILVVKPIF